MDKFSVYHNMSHQIFLLSAFYRCDRQHQMHVSLLPSIPLHAFFVRVSHAHSFFSSPSLRLQDPRFSRAGVRRAHHRLPQPVGRHRDHHHVQTRGVRQANQEGRLCEIPLQRLSDGWHAHRLHVSRPICLHIYLRLYQDKHVFCAVLPTY